MAWQSSLSTEIDLLDDSDSDEERQAKTALVCLLVQEYLSEKNERPTFYARKRIDCEKHTEDMRKHLESKPDLVATGVANLPEEVFIESSYKPSSTISSSTKRKREQESEIAEAIHELKTNHMEVELSKRKLDLIQHQQEFLTKDEECLQKEEEQKAAEQATKHLFKQQEEAHKAAEHLFRQQKEVRKATEHLFRQQEEANIAREHLLNEWERIQLNITEVNRALGNEKNELIKRDMESDIVLLINRKNQLADRLNFT